MQTNNAPSLVSRPVRELYNLATGKDVQPAYVVAAMRLRAYTTLIWVPAFMLARFCLALVAIVSYLSRWLISASYRKRSKQFGNKRWGVWFEHKGLQKASQWINEVLRGHRERWHDSYLEETVEHRQRMLRFLKDFRLREYERFTPLAFEERLESVVLVQCRLQREHKRFPDVAKTYEDAARSLCQWLHNSGLHPTDPFYVSWVRYINCKGSDQLMTFFFGKVDQRPLPRVPTALTKEDYCPAAII